jgi:3-dehydroquinate dehydratase-1
VEKICISIGDRPRVQIRELLSAGGLCELRLDLISDFEPLEELIRHSTAKVIATCRPGRYPETERVSLLTRCVKAHCFAVDLEYEYTLKEVMTLAKESGVKVLISYHNMTETPEIGELRSVVRQAGTLGADIIKIACQVNSARDAARLIGLLDSPEPLIISGLGEQGRILRVIGPILGSLCSFASVDEASATASGQLSGAALSEALLSLERAVSG